MKHQTPQSSFEPTIKHLTDIIELQSELGSADFDLMRFMQTVVDKVKLLTKCGGAVIELMDGDEMVYRAGNGTIAPYIGTRLKAATSLSGLCVQTGQILYSEDTSTDLRVDIEACKKVHAASIVVVPLFRSGRTIGVLKIVSDRAYAFGIHDFQTLQLMAMLIGGALGQQIEMQDQRIQGEQYRQMAHYDSLTGLPNRQLLYDRLEHALVRSKRSKRPVALMYMDIDYFKSVNDTYGHAVGDHLLISFVERVKGCIRASDTFARLGGDEFVLIAEEIRQAEDAKFIGDKILEAMKPKLMLEGHEFQLSTSIGIIVSTSATVDMPTLVRTADKALYQAKHDGRGCYHLMEM